MTIDEMKREWRQEFPWNHRFHPEIENWWLQKMVEMLEDLKYQWVVIPADTEPVKWIRQDYFLQNIDANLTELRKEMR